MRKTVAVAVIAAACAAAGCDHSRTISLSGEVTYAEYQDGVIAIQICESESSSHDGAEVVVQTPGECVARLVLAEPGEFSTRVTISWADAEPEVQLLAFLVPSEESDVWSDCEAGAAASVSVADHSDIELDLVAGDCPLRQ